MPWERPKEIEKRQKRQKKKKKKEREKERDCVCADEHISLKAEFTQLKGRLVEQGWLQQEPQPPYQGSDDGTEVPTLFPSFWHSATKGNLAFEHLVY